MKLSNAEKAKRWREKHPEKHLESQRKWREKNKEYNSDRQRKYQLKYSYGITEIDYTRMLTEQDGKCAICSTSAPTGRWKVFAVDHCHTTNTIRGLLCNECNRGMGLMKDDASRLRMAAEYLDKHKVITNLSRKPKDIPLE